MCKAPPPKFFVGKEQPSARPAGTTPTTPAFTRRQAFIPPNFLNTNFLHGVKTLDGQLGMQRGSLTHSSPCDHGALALEMDLELALLASGSVSGHKRKAEDCFATGDAAVLGDLSDERRFKRLLSEVSSSRDDSNTSSDAQREAELQLLEQQVQQQQRRLQEQQQMLLESQRRNQQLIRYIRSMSAQRPNALRTAAGFLDASAGGLVRAGTQAASAGHQSRLKLFRAVRTSSSSAVNGTAAAATQQQLALMLESVSNEDLSQAIQQALRQQLTQQQQQEAAAVPIPSPQILQQPQQQQMPAARSESPASSGSRQQQKQRKPKRKKPTHVPISACLAPPAAAPAPHGADSAGPTMHKIAVAPAAFPCTAVSPAAPELHQQAKQQQLQQLQLQPQLSVQGSLAPSPDTMLSSTGGGSSSCCSAALDLPPVPAEFGTGVLRFNSSCGDLLALLEGLGGTE